MVRPAQLLGSLQRYEPTLPAPPCRTLRVPSQPRALALASDLLSCFAVHFLDHGRLLASGGPSTSPYTANALLPMSVVVFTYQIGNIGSVRIPPFIQCSYVKKTQKSTPWRGYIF